MASSRSSFESSWASVAEAILGSAGALTRPEREAVYAGDDPPELATLLGKVRLHAYRIVDADLAGIDVDVAVEATLAAALGCAMRDRARALEALG